MQQLVIVTYNDIKERPTAKLFSELMEGIPTLAALDYVVERQNRFIFAFSDIEGQKNALFEMRVYMQPDEQKQLDCFMADHPKPILFMNQSCLSFYAKVLHLPNTNKRELTNDEKRRIYLAYLLCNEEWTDRQKAGFVADRDKPENMLLKIDMLISEFKRHKDFKAALYKATQLFRFCEKHEDYWAVVTRFLADHKVSNWRMYLLNLLELYTKTLPIEGMDTVNLTEFEEQYAFGLDDDIVDNSSIFWLRDHFIVKRGDGSYLVLNNNLIVDKMYQGLKFDLFKTARDNNLLINGREMSSVDKFNEELGTDFSEEYLMYDLMDRIYDTDETICYCGSYLKGKVDAEPDYYLRKGDKMLLIEHKDVLISEKNKQETDIAKIVDAVEDKICREKTEKKGRKGGPQLLHTIDGIFVNDTMKQYDEDAKIVDLVYPVVTVVDSAFSALGVAFATVRKFSEFAQNYDTIKQGLIHVLPITIIDIDTLFVLSKRLHDKELDLFALIEEYQKMLCTKGRDIYDMPSFSSFIADYYPLYELTEEDNNFILSNFNREIAKLE